MGNIVSYFRVSGQSPQLNIFGFSVDKHILQSVIQTTSGLLDELYTRAVLDQEQIERIRNDKTATGEVHQLLNEVENMSHIDQEQFLLALDKTGQSHVTNYICNNGQRPTTDFDNWPIYELEKWHRIVSNWSKLTDLIDSRNGLLDELRSVSYISTRQSQFITAQPGDAARNEMLLEISRSKSVRDYKKFIECLTDTKQHHVVWLLEPDHSTLVQPVLEEQLKTLTMNYSTLVQLMELGMSGLTAELLAAGVITWRQKEYVESAIASASESNRRLLDIVKRGSEENYLKFIDCLRRIGQMHIAIILQSNGVVAEMVAKSDLSLSEEKYTVKQFFEIYRKVFPDKKEQLRREFEYISDALQGSLVIAMEPRHSIKFSILCTSLTGLHYLNKLYTSGQLRIHIEYILSVLFDHKRLVTVRSLEWETSDYDKCTRYFSAKSDLTDYTELDTHHSTATQTVSDEKGYLNPRRRRMKPTDSSPSNYAASEVEIVSTHQSTGTRGPHHELSPLPTRTSLNVDSINITIEDHDITI